MSNIPENTGQDAALRAFTGVPVFDGRRFVTGQALLVEGARLRGLVPETALPAEARRVVLEGGFLAPGFVDLQVNGGGGVLFNDHPDRETLAIMARAHARLGATTIFPTLITDTPARTRAAIDAVAAACRDGLPGIAGLHLEGPHLDPLRKGAHNPALIRPMETEDLALLLQAAKRLPALLVTLAPASATPEQVRRLVQAGVLVSLGHSDADFATARHYFAAGARSVTHLFNAMSQMQGRAPGLVGAALDTETVSAGLIADAIHVAPEMLALALRAKRGSNSLYLVSDAMAPAGTDMRAFTLNGRRITRNGGRLTLEDGTLAGADLDLARALRVMVRQVGVQAETALAMATACPADLAGLSPERGWLQAGSRADFIHMQQDFRLLAVWQGGQCLPIA